MRPHLPRRRGDILHVSRPRSSLVAESVFKICCRSPWGSAKLSKRSQLGKVSCHSLRGCKGNVSQARKSLALRFCLSQVHLALAECTPQPDPRRQHRQHPSPPPSSSHQQRACNRPKTDPSSRPNYSALRQGSRVSWVQWHMDPGHRQMCTTTQTPINACTQAPTDPDSPSRRRP